MLRIPNMAFNLDLYKERTARLRWDDLDFTSFESSPLDEDVLRCIRYMHDVEFHTVCYLRDLLLTPAHGDPEVTAFLSFWVYEEYWHGEVLAGVLEAHGESFGSSRIAPMRRGLGIRDKFRPYIMSIGSSLIGDDFVALHMSWGAINELTTQAGYAQLSRRAGHPVLSALLSRIMKQEGLHIDFYYNQSMKRLAESSRSRTLTRAALAKFWKPVGAGVMSESETQHLGQFLFGDQMGQEALQRIDRRIDRLPGLANLSLLESAVEPISLSRPAMSRIA